MGNIVSQANKLGGNLLMNGDMHFWQRNTSFTSAAAVVNTCDRWKLENQTGVSMLWDQVASPPPGTRFRYVSRIRNNATGSPTGIQRLAAYQIIEQNILTDIFGKGLFYSGHIWSNYNCDIPLFVYLGNPGVNPMYYATRTVTLVANTWTRFEFFLDVPPVDPAQFNNIALNEIGGYVGFHMDAGPSVTGTLPTTWNSFNPTTSEPVRMGTGMTKMLAVANREIRFTGFKLGLTPQFSLCGLNHQQELSLCQRYFEKSYDTFTAPGTVTNNGMVTGAMGASGNNVGLTSQFRVQKRSVPVMVYYDLNGNINRASFVNGGSGAVSENHNAIQVTHAGHSCAHWWGSTGVVGAGGFFRTHFTAEADF